MLEYRKTLLSTMLVVLLSGSAFVFAAKEPKSGHHASQMLKCAAVCADCQVQCDSCFHHCATLAGEGKKDHVHCMRLCVDCADYCRLCSTICARKSTFSHLAAESCSKVCDDCAAACEAFPDDEHMATCAKVCRNCAKECREMINMTKEVK